LEKYTEQFRNALNVSHTEDGVTVITLEDGFSAKLKNFQSAIINRNSKKKVRDSSCVSQLGTGKSVTAKTDVPYSALGRAISVGDFNKDGYDDLAMGAPGTGGPGNPESGAVYIIYGHPVTGKETVNVNQRQNVTSVSNTISNMFSLPSRY
jgi:hypothetical protein